MQTIYIVLMMSAIQVLSLQFVFVMEAYNTAVIDTACSETVCSSNWLLNFVHSLSPTEKQKVHCHESHIPFKSEDGVAVYSNQNVRFLARIGTVNCLIKI